MRIVFSAIAAFLLLGAASPAQAQVGDWLRQGRDSIESALSRESDKESARSDRWNPPVGEEEKKRINSNYERTIVQGAVLGGAAGFVIAKLFGADKRTVRLATKGGAELGAMIGKNYADEFASMADSKHRTENQIEALQKNSEVLQQSLTATEENITYIRSEIKKLRAQLKRGAIQQADLDSFRKDAQKELDDAKETLDRAHVTYAEAQQTLEQVQKADKPEVKALQPRAQKAVDDLSQVDRRAESLNKDVSAAVNAVA